MTAADGGPGPRADALVEGGFARAWLDDPGRLALWANRQGGFTVRCPRTDDPVVGAFSAAWERARHGAGPLATTCPSCGAEHPLPSLVFRPAAAFGRWAVVLGGAASATLAASAADEWPALSAMVSVVRRG